MTALSTNYGAPAPKTPASNYGSNDYSLHSNIGHSKLASKKLGSNKRKSFIPLDSREGGFEKDIELGKKTSAGMQSVNMDGSGSGIGNERSGFVKKKEQERWRWDENEHTARVDKGDVHSMESHESKQMIIERNTEWTVEFQGRDEGSATEGRYQGHVV